MPCSAETSQAARPMRFRQSGAASRPGCDGLPKSRRWKESGVRIGQHGAGRAHGDDGESVGAEPTSTWKPGFTSRISCMTFSRSSELLLTATMSGCWESDYGFGRDIDAVGLRPVVDHDGDLGLIRRRAEEERLSLYG